MAAERGWQLLAAHVRTNHVHVVVQAERDPGRLMCEIKARASRDLTRAGFAPFSLPAPGFSTCASEGAGDRTQDLRIKSPLLYQLSYAFGDSLGGGAG
jgi:hypothetical protein